MHAHANAGDLHDPRRALSARGELEEKCCEIAASLAVDMAAEGLKGRTVTLKIKLTSFEVGLWPGAFGASHWVKIACTDMLCIRCRDEPQW
jgi:hypothetical protein